MKDPEVRKKAAALNAGLTRSKVEHQGWSKAEIPEGAGDPAQSAEASYTPDFASVLDHDKVPENLPHELLIRGLLLVREDSRPHLSIDCIILGLRHPFYRAYDQVAVASWNSVNKATVCVRVKQTLEKLGLTPEIVQELSGRYADLPVDQNPLHHASNGLVMSLLYVAQHDEPKRMIDCILIASGHKSSDGVSLKTVGQRFGVTKAAIHKQIKAVKMHLNLPRCRFNKSPESSLQYARYNKNLKRVGDLPNGVALTASPCRSSSEPGSS